MIVIANFGMGNFVSVANMLKFLNFEVEVRDTPGNIEEASHLIIPGVGAFDAGITALESSGWATAIRNLPETTKVLGICLGMQLLSNGSEEGSLAGLNIVDAYCKKFDKHKSKVPHMGWNSIKVNEDGKDLFKGSENRFYFSHSFYIEPNHDITILSTTNYQVEFVSSLKMNNFYGVQFHPEKSHKFGMDFLMRFSNL